MEYSLLQYIGSIGGVGAVLAVLMFFSYRYLVGQMRQDRKYMEDRMAGLLDEYNQIQKDSKDAQIKHTQILTELIVWLKAKNGSK